MSAELEEFATQEQKRRELALRVRSAHDVNLPVLENWNYEPCRFHDEPKPDCEYRLCGGPLFRHQRVGVAFFMMTDGVLADMTGLGKTNQVIFLIALKKERGELTNRAVVVCGAPAVAQWVHEFSRFAPRLNVIAATGTRAKRVEKYVTQWDVVIISYQMLLKDIDTLMQFSPFSVLAEDDVDPIRNVVTSTHRVYNRLAYVSDRVVNVNATPLQIQLEELYSTTVSVGGFEVFGSLRAFQRRYVRQEMVPFWTGRGRKSMRYKTVGYKNLTEFKEKMRPLYLRRTYDDVDDVRVPDVVPEDVWLELHPEQRKRYKELQEGVLRILKEEGEAVKHVEALAKVTYGAEICSGLPALGEPDGPQASAKLDWFMRKIVGDWADEKVVLFARFRGTVRALQARLAEVDVGMATIWSEQPSAEFRKGEVDRFWNDPKCRVIAGTTAIERSLNLQNARIVVNLDTLLNPARMTQVLGRVRRVGSSADHVYMFNVFMRDTQEERYLPVLERRQALADFVWGEASEVFDQLSPVELLHLIRP